MNVCIWIVVILPLLVFFHRTRDCVFSKSYIELQLRQLSLLSSLFCLSSSIPSVFADVTSCRCFEILVHKAEVGGCSRTEVEDRRPSFYVLSQAVLGTPGASW